MTEELYIIKGVNKYRLDLNSPSGITLKFQSNIFGDVSKITASYSYTFKLPMTTNNRRLLDIAEDVRHKSSTTRTKLQAEFHQDGVPIFRGGNLYVSRVQKEYQCVMTWDIAEGFANLKENDCSLNELPDNGDKVRYGGATKNNLPLIGEFDNTANALNPWYGCGGKNWWEVTNLPAGYGTQPLPVVPVYRLISMINQAFGTRFKLGDAFDSSQFSTTTGEFPILRNDIINRGVIHLCSIDIDESDLEKEIATIRISRAITNCYRNGDDYECWAFKGIDTEDLSVYDLIIVDITNGQEELLRGNNDFLSVQSYSFYSQWVVSADNIHLGKFFELDGFVVASFKNVKNVDYQPPEYALYSVPKMTLYAVNFERDKDDPTTGKFVGESIASIEGTPYMDATSAGEWFIFDFREAEGKSRLKVESIAGSSNPFFFAFDYKVENINGSMQAIPIYNENTNVGNGGYDIPIVPNLPDVSCLTFIKSLFYMLGAFPTTNKSGEIVPIYFNDLKIAIENNEVLDWSSKVLGGDNAIADNVDFSVSGFGKNNYYLMKSDSLEDKDKEKDDVYADGIGCITVESDVIDAKKTIIQLPYNAPYILNKKKPRMATGDTFKCWEVNSNNEVTFKEPQPCFGMIVGRPERVYKGSGDINDVANYNPTGRWLEYMEAWNGFKDLQNNPSYAYLQEIMSTPIVITEEIRLTNLDLMNLDYSKPVYLNKYNAFFAIVSVQRDSKGKCKVELIKLP